ncbi:MAG: DUF3267 domain-containing protein [Bacteroidales bacterium]|nr:DUF3267 domain-containing protein [Bacteroidales bacterium]MCF8337563.1 DUF3267 domain-containing protein [Bacteroidales bacterium]
MELSTEKRELTVSAKRANIVALLFLIPIIILGIGFLLVWAPHLPKEAFKNLFLDWGFWFLPILIGGIVVHELIHGLTWALFTSRGFRSIRFGILWKMFTPYCHSKEALKAWQYRLGAIMPAIVLGFIPVIAAYFTGSFGLMGFGMIFTLAAGGDFLILWLLRKTPKEALVEDHPSKPGCYVYE